MSNQGKGPEQVIADLNEYLSKLGKKGKQSGGVTATKMVFNLTQV